MTTLEIVFGIIIWIIRGLYCAHKLIGVDGISWNQLFKDRTPIYFILAVIFVVIFSPVIWCLAIIYVIIPWPKR